MQNYLCTLTYLLLVASGTNLRLFINNYRTRAIISRCLYIFYPIFKDHFFVFKEVFSENSVLMYGLYSRAACNQERLMMARVRYLLNFVSPQWKLYNPNYHNHDDAKRSVILVFPDIDSFWLRVELKAATRYPTLSLLSSRNSLQSWGKIWSSIMICIPHVHSHSVEYTIPVLYCVL